MDKARQKKFVLRTSVPMISMVTPISILTVAIKNCRHLFIFVISHNPRYVMCPNSKPALDNISARNSHQNELLVEHEIAGDSYLDPLSTLEI